jgi:hypothetical protein
MTKFSDLDAMDDADWDKVIILLNSLWLASRRLTVTVLVNQCQEQLPPFQGCFAHFQHEPRRWCLYPHILNCGMPRKVVIGAHFLLLTSILGCYPQWQQYTIRCDQGSLYVLSIILAEQAIR